MTYPCELEGQATGVGAAALYVYRLDRRVKEEPLRYRYDGASP
ncbi:hypothetical protein [Streptomyces sp. NPDC048603]